MKSEILLSEQQKEILTDVDAWLKKVWSDMPASEKRLEIKQFKTIGGYAGTGKTTLVIELRKALERNFKDGSYVFFTKNNKKDLRVGFCSFTGKASQILQSKLKNSNSLQKKDIVSTIHSLIYTATKNSEGEVVGFDLKDRLEVDILVIDEASMITRDLWNDLLHFRIPIIAMGDHGQLPPIDSSFNLMEKPELTLTKIFRQKDENPIIDLSMYIRENGNIPAVDSREFSDISKKLDLKNDHRVQIFSNSDLIGKEVVADIIDSYKADTLILCAYNNTRVRLNTAIRAKKFEFEDDWEAIGSFRNSELSEKEIREKVFNIPKKNDSIICLKNNSSRGIFNGMIGIIKQIENHSEKLYKLEIELEPGEHYESYAAKEQFGLKGSLDFKNIPMVDFSTGNTKEGRLEKADVFDFGYALTVHKAQGSQAEKVLLFAEKMKQMDEETWKRWLYTAVTRAVEEIVVII